MSQYRRVFVPGGTYFFTVTLADRQAQTLVEHINVLRASYARVQTQHPFRTLAICVLPDHLHALWRLPDGDRSYPLRWALIKRYFSSQLPAAEDRSASKLVKREKGIWQRRYWEHCIRDEADLAAHVEYIHNNPVKHALVQDPDDWPYSSIRRRVGNLLPTIHHHRPSVGNKLPTLPGFC